MIHFNIEQIFHHRPNNRQAAPCCKQEDPKIVETKKNESLICTMVSNTVKSMVDIFSPVIDYVGSFDVSKARTVSELNDLLNSTRERINKDENLNKQLSKRGSEALNRLYTTVSLLNSREDLRGMDLTELITKWRGTRNHQALFEMAQKIRNNECVTIKDKRLRKEFINGLESFAEALEEVAKNPPSQAKDKVVKELTCGADGVVNGVERVQEKGGDDKLTTQDKKYIRDQLTESTKCVEHIKQDPALSSLLPHTFSTLCHWAYDVTTFLHSWCTDAKREEHKKAREKLCARRMIMKRYFDRLCRKYHAEKRKAEEFYFYMKNMQKKMIESKKTEFAGKYDFAKEQYLRHANNGDFFKAKEEGILMHMPPSSVCDPLGLKLELDLIC